MLLYMYLPTTIEENYLIPHNTSQFVHRSEFCCLIHACSHVHVKSVTFIIYVYNLIATYILSGERKDLKKKKPEVSIDIQIKYNLHYLLFYLFAVVHRNLNTMIEALLIENLSPVLITGMVVTLCPWIRP